MQLLDHVPITLRSLADARVFYLAVMSALDAVVAYDRVVAIGVGERNRSDDDVHTDLSVYESAQASVDPRHHWHRAKRDV